MEDKFKITHTGHVVVPYLRGFRKVFLRQTPKFWIDAEGTRYRKSDGLRTGKDQVVYLDLSTVAPYELKNLSEGE